MKRPTNPHIQKLQSLFFTPKDFLKLVQTENDYFKILIFYVVIATIAAFISAIVSVPTVYQLGAQGATEVIALTLISPIFTAIFSFIFPFVWAFLIHLGVLIFGGTKGYFNTFKPITYGLIIGTFYSVFQSIVNFIVHLLFPIDPLAALETDTSLFLGEFLLPHVLFAMLISIIALVHVLYFNTIAVAKYQQLSPARAFISIIFFPLILGLGSILLVMLVTFSILAP